MFQDMDSGLSTAPVKNTVLAASSLIMNMKGGSATKLVIGYLGHCYLIMSTAAAAASVYAF
jgi:hypothetical protein